ncbi:TetR/AcrR family transcriptional regulator [Nocardioides glacieisoli]|uniref:TetR/AcrR family transcriptional regulator n=1 Tax=Nocardioides glacieisoli TaxID=1168730 RepID=A0A4Q2RLW1_9ACTN|nr:TetR/AcrR family transcriptional regulator [Nocardioides glacieisoli]RYB88555.1 TetR/AcrR family transcriptional regulator [Nocardioides glacieisoli]
MPPRRAQRNTLDRDRVLTSAMLLADRDGLDALTIRGLAAELGVRPMAIYHYVASKDELLDELVDLVFREVYVPCGQDWRTELFQRSTSMREALGRHPWALPVVDTRSHPGPAMLANHEAVLDVLRGSGFSLQATTHAYAVMDAYVYGFALQEVMLQKAGLPDSAPKGLEDITLARFPRISELATIYITAPVYPLLASFDIGLNLILDGIGRFTDLFPEPKETPDQ